MSDFEQMLAEINVPEEIAHQIATSATPGDVLAMWETLTAAVDEVWGNAPTADCICSLAMLLAFTGEKLAANVKFGKSPEDEGENVHPNFCIMAIALIAVNTLKASQSARSDNDLGDGDGGEKDEEPVKENPEENPEEKGKEKGKGKKSNGDDSRATAPKRSRRKS